MDAAPSKAGTTTSEVKSFRNNILYSFYTRKQISFMNFCCLLPFDVHLLRFVISSMSLRLWLWSVRSDCFDFNKFMFPADFMSLSCSIFSEVKRVFLFILLFFSWKEEKSVTTTSDKFGKSAFVKESPSVNGIVYRHGVKYLDSEIWNFLSCYKFF